MTRDLENDLVYLTAAAEDLEDYILSTVMDWPLSGVKGTRLQGETSQLTPGNLLLSLKRVNAARWSDKEKALVQQINRDVARVCAQWRSNWEKKARKDYEKRLKLWVNYLEDLVNSPVNLRGDYTHNIRQRVILHLLAEELGDSAALHDLAGIDQRMKPILHPSDFIWEKDLSKGFPEEEFWYLYARP